MKRSVIVAVLAVLLLGCSERFDAAEAFSVALSDTTGGDRVLLSEIAPFEWDRSVVLRAYTSDEDAERLLGFPASNVVAVQDLIHTILFVRDGRIVAQSEFHGGLLRFDGPGIAFDPGGPALTVIHDPTTGDEYLVPEGVGPRDVLCGPAGLGGCD